jgi:hypothetical protein
MRRPSRPGSAFSGCESALMVRRAALLQALRGLRPREVPRVSNHEGGPCGRLRPSRRRVPRGARASRGTSHPDETAESAHLAVFYPPERRVSGVRMTSFLRRSGFLPSAIIIMVAIVWGVLFVYVDGVCPQHLKDATSARALALFSLAHSLFFVATVIGCVVFVLRRKWLSALCYLTAACVTYASDYVSLAVKDDRFTFPLAPTAKSPISTISVEQASDLIILVLASLLSMISVTHPHFANAGF